jgi:4-hydroxy-tetrahydrodipicolinate synthase
MTFTGVFVPLITPFDPAGAVAGDALEALAHEVLDGGAHGLVALGTTGEPGSLSEAERRSVVDVVARVCRERHAQLIVGGDPAGVPAQTAAVLSLVPPFVRPGEDGVVAYFTRLARHSPAPLIIYHVPYRTGQPLSAATLRRLAGLGNVAGVKLAPGVIDAETVALLADPPPGFAVLAGDDVLLSPLLALGAHGGILASAHVNTAGFVDLVDAWDAGDARRARSVGNRLAALSLALFAEPNPAVVKAVLHANGRIPAPGVRLPLLSATPHALAAALAAQSGCEAGAVTARS